MDLKQYIDAVFTDLDGTLLRKRKTRIRKKVIADISPKTARMLRKIVNQKGINIVPTTARHPDNVLDLLKSKLPFRSLKFKVPYIIGASGALIKDQNGQVIRKKTIDPETVKHIIEVLNKHDVLYCILTSDNKWYKVPSVRHNDYLQGDTRKFITVKGNPIKQLGNDITEILQIVPYIDPSNDEHRGKLKAIEQDLQNLKVDVSASSDRLLEIGPEETDKGEAISFLCRKQKWDPQRLIAFGDSDNDKTMFQRVGISFIMPKDIKNDPSNYKLSETLLPYAKYIARGSNRSDGVAHELSTLLKAEDFGQQFEQQTGQQITTSYAEMLSIAADLSRPRIDNGNIIQRSALEPEQNR